MKRYFRIVCMVAVCALGAQNVFPMQSIVQSNTTQQPMLIVVNGQQTEVKGASSMELLTAFFKKAGQDALQVTEGLIAAACIWSAGRHYQMTRDSQDGWQALFRHEDCLPNWLWMNYRPLCLTVAAAGTSYIGYKLYRYFANKKAQAQKPGMVNEETQTSLF